MRLLVGPAAYLQYVSRPKPPPSMAQFQIRFPLKDIEKWAQRYSFPGEARIVEQVAPPAKERGHLTRDEFLQLTYWKTPRSKSRCARNNSALIEEVTRIALSTKEEQLKIQVLTVLEGVSWPTASVILHFCDQGRYPILDFRALWSLRTAVPAQYTFPFWWDYTLAVRRLQDQSGVDMRTLDRALWQYSKDKQRRASNTPLCL